MNLISNLLVGGIVTGCIYALVAIGFVVLYRATRVFSLAQGSFMVLGATILYTLEQHGLSLFWAGLASVAATAVLGAAVYFFLFSGRLLSAEPLTVAIATIALSTLLSMIVVLIWGANPLALRDTLSFKPIRVGGVLRFSRADLITVLAAVLLVLAITSSLRWTRLGLRMRATADSAGLAVYSGVNVRATSMLAWGLGAFCAGFAGVVACLGSGQVDPINLPSIGLLAFPAILLGGLESVGGALFGGVAVGIVGSFGAHWWGSAWAPVIPYLVLFIVLLLRPNGLFGTRRLSRL